MRRLLILAIALAILTANTAFVVPRVESTTPHSAQQLITSGDSDHTPERLHKT